VESLKKELNAAEALARHNKPAQAKLEEAARLVKRWQDVAENFERRVVPSLQVLTCC
jgi:phage-related minor tail protein